MSNNLADFIAVAARPLLAMWLCLVPFMLLEELEIHQGKGRRRR